MSDAIKANVEFPVPPLSPDAQEWRERYERMLADGSVQTQIRPIHDQLHDVMEELGISS